MIFSRGQKIKGVSRNSRVAGLYEFGQLKEFNTKNIFLEK